MSAVVEILLIQDVPGLGEFGQKRSVKAGYARNYLFPQMFALLATPQNEARFASFRKKEDKRRAEVKQVAESLAQKVQGQVLNFTSKTHGEGKLYGSVSAGDIVAKLNETLGLDLDKSCVQLAEPIKEVGKLEVVLQFAYSVQATVTVDVQSEVA